ncbi:MAG: hypothetical protein C4527_03465 [Candidatus Omnitrophota bacterium]|nr:MAG: hypothetical protein C4527_03465 [Candidatus Omnitrophota bacterium]
MKIRISVGPVNLTATLWDNETARVIYDALPFDLPYHTWGDEIYFAIPVSLEPEDGREIMEVGELAYWPPGHAFCIFYGRTPASTDDRPRAASEVTPIGKVEGDIALLKKVNSSTIRIEKLIAE